MEGTSARTLFISFSACLQLVALLQPGEGVKLPRECALEGDAVTCHCRDRRPSYRVLNLTSIDPAWKRIHVVQCPDTRMWLHAETGDPISLDALSVEECSRFQLMTRDPEHRDVPVRIQQVTITDTFSFTFRPNSLCNAEITTLSVTREEDDVALQIYDDSFRNTLFEEFLLFGVNLWMQGRMEVNVTKEWSFADGTLIAVEDLHSLTVQSGDNKTQALKFQVINVTVDTHPEQPDITSFRVYGFEEAIFKEFRDPRPVEFDFAKVGEVVFRSSSLATLGRNSLRLSRCGCSARVTFFDNSIDDLPDAEAWEVEEDDEFYRIGMDYFGSLFTKAGTLDHSMIKVKGKHLLLH